MGTQALERSGTERKPILTLSVAVPPESSAPSESIVFPKFLPIS
jgi:hypothetical protein